jgi:hypothetical protein
MKIFNKVAAFFIIASFVFSGESFARKHARDDRENASTIKRTLRKPLAIDRRKARVSRAHNARVKKEEQLKARRNLKARGHGVKTKTAAQNMSEKMKATAAAKTKAARSIAERTKLTTRAKAKVAQSTENRTKAAARAKTKVTQSTENRKNAAARAKTKVTQSTENRTKPIAAAKARPSKLSKNKKRSARTPQYYTIRTRDLPADLQNDVKLFVLSKGEKLKPQYQASSQEIREMLTAIQVIERHAPGITQKARTYLANNGYVAGTNRHVVINTQTLPKELKYYVSIFALEEGESLKQYYILPEAKITKMLNKMQQRENRSQGATQRARVFLKSKYGFQG